MGASAQSARRDWCVLKDADVLVAGSGVFAAGDPAGAIEEIRLAGTDAQADKGRA